MLILHRITPLAIGVTIGLGVAALLAVSVNPWAIIGATLVMTFLLLGRLVNWQVTKVSFWMLVGIPFLLTASSFTFMLFLESRPQTVILGLVTALLVFFFCEHLFTYVHVPAAYQTYAIEYLALTLNVVTVFVLASSAYAFRLFLQTPLPALVSCFFAAVLFVFVSTLWVSKIEKERVRAFSVCGAVILTEIFAVMAFLPTGFLTNAAVLTVFLYTFLGVSRAQVAKKLSRGVLMRYLVTASVLVAVILGTAKWV